jgi:CheY-like chemotaxis protein
VLLAVASFDFTAGGEVGEGDRATLLAVTDACAVALDRARATEAEAVALRKKDEFLAVLGHELRNPLAPILTATRLIRLRGAASDRELDVLERQSRHLVRLVDDLLDVSRIASGKLELRKRSIETSEVVAQAVESTIKAFEDKRLRLDVDVPGTGLVVDGDRERLVQVVTNLLVNAAKYTPEGRAVAVRAVRQDDQMVLEFRDEGQGVAPDLLPSIFEPFTQGRQASDRRDGGLGLGLAIARSIIEAHGGTIAASSAGVDRGTTITVKLPACGESKDASAPSLADAPQPAEAARRVLIVDDNRDAAEMIASFLGALGYETSVAYDGPAALTAVARARPDAAILDIGLPGMDGYELARELRARHGEGTPPLIALTGYAQSDDRRRAFDSGFRAHFAKPADLERLAAALRDIVDAHADVGGP